MSSGFWWLNTLINRAMMPFVMMASLSARNDIVPHPTLTALYYVVGGFLAVLDNVEGVGEFDKVLVLVEPLVVDGKLLNNLVLYLVDCHFSLC